MGALLRLMKRVETFRMQTTKKNIYIYIYPKASSKPARISLLYICSPTKSPYAYNVDALLTISFTVFQKFCYGSYATTFLVVGATYIYTSKDIFIYSVHKLHSMSDTSIYHTPSTYFVTNHYNNLHLQYGPYIDIKEI